MTNKNTQDYLKFSLPILQDAVKPGGLIGISGFEKNHQLNTAILLLKDFAENNPPKETTENLMPTILYVNLDDDLETQVDMVLTTLGLVDNPEPNVDFHSLVGKFTLLESIFTKYGYHFAFLSTTTDIRPMVINDPGLLLNKLDEAIQNFVKIGLEVKAIAVTSNWPVPLRLKNNLARYLHSVCFNKELFGIQTTVYKRGQEWSSADFFTSATIESTIFDNGQNRKISLKLLRCQNKQTGLKSELDLDQKSL